MAIWQDANGNLYDDMNGEALSLPSWPPGMTKLTDAQVATIQAQQAAAQAALPNPQAFISACKTALGGPTGILAQPATVQSAINLALAAISSGDWHDVQVYITSMQAALGATVYSEIKSAAAQYNISMTL